MFCLLTGMLEPTAGSIHINGMDIKTNMEEIRSKMGLCPQNNLLFTDLTVEEHLLLFAKVNKYMYICLNVDSCVVEMIIFILFH